MTRASGVRFEVAQWRSGSDVRAETSGTPRCAYRARSPLSPATVATYIVVWLPDTAMIRRFGSRLAGVHRAASDDLYDAGSKPDQDANLPSVVIGPGDI